MRSFFKETTQNGPDDFEHLYQIRFVMLIWKFADGISKIQVLLVIFTDLCI